MYLREPYNIDDRDRQLDFIRRDGWGHIIGVQDGVPFVSHHPFYLHGDKGEEKLEFHAPKVNPHLQNMCDGQQVQVVFEGPKHYMSPRWCKTERELLPTWIFVAVHVFGRPKMVRDADEVTSALGRLIDFNEARLGGEPWSLNSVSEEHVRPRLSRIVGLEMPIERIEANFRLLQNRPAEDRRDVMEALSKLPDTHAHKVADLIRQHSSEDDN